MVNIFTCCFLVLIFFGFQCDATKFIKDYYGDPPKMQEIRVPSGSNISLRCDADKCNPKYQMITWKFSGQQIPLNKNCVDLELTNVTINLSGIYVCLINTVISHTYKVEVIELNHYDSILPKVLSVTPSNTTVPQYTNIVVQCRTGTSARAPPHVFWFKRTASKGGATVRDALPYGNYSYVKISDGSTGAGGMAASPHSVPNEKNVYLSKLSIHNATEKDSGVYACMVMTELGSDVQYFVVEVVTPTNSRRVTETLSLLFLIPLSFALIPGIVWLCYSRCYHRKQNAKCKLAAATAAESASAVANNTYSSSPHRPQHVYYHRNPRHPDIKMIRMLHSGDGASVSTEPEVARLLKMPRMQRTVSVV